MLGSRLPPSFTPLTSPFVEGVVYLDSSPSGYVSRDFPLMGYAYSWVAHCWTPPYRSHAVQHLLAAHHPFPLWLPPLWISVLCRAYAKDIPARTAPGERVTVHGIDLSYSIDVGFGSAFSEYKMNQGSATGSSHPFPSHLYRPCASCPFLAVFVSPILSPFIVCSLSEFDESVVWRCHYVGVEETDPGC